MLKAICIGHLRLGAVAGRLIDASGGLAAASAGVSLAGVASGFIISGVGAGLASNGYNDVADDGLVNSDSRSYVRAAVSGAAIEAAGGVVLGAAGVVLRPFIPKLVAIPALQPLIRFGTFLDSKLSALGPDNQPTKGIGGFGPSEEVVQVGWRSFRFSEEAVAQMTERKISMSDARRALSQEPFDYIRKNEVRQGFFDPATNTFVGTSNGFVTTTMQGSRVRPYVERLGWHD